MLRHDGGTYQSDRLNGTVWTLKAADRRRTGRPAAARISSALIDDLHAPLFSFITGAATAVLVGAMAAWRTDSPSLAALTICTALVAAARILSIAHYREHRPGAGNDVDLLRRFERRYAVGAIVYAALLGFTAFVAYVFTDDTVSFLLLNANGVGYAAGATARNSSRPRIAAAQLVFILLPVALGSALRMQPAYAVLSAITVLYLVSSIEITQYLGINRLRLLLTTREKGELAELLAEQNVLFDATLNNMAIGLCMFDAEQQLRIANHRFSELFRIAPDELAPGASIQHVMALARASDSNPVFAAAAQQRLLADPTAPVVTTLADGRMISISHRPMPNGVSWPLSRTSPSNAAPKSAPGFLPPTTTSPACLTASSSVKRSAMRPCSADATAASSR